MSECEVIEGLRSLELSLCRGFESFLLSTTKSECCGMTLTEIYSAAEQIKNSLYGLSPTIA